MKETFASLLFVLALTIEIGADIPRPRGVSLVKASLYQPGVDNSWVCLEGAKKISFKQINDDYCDCADGSDEPGTSACANGQFHCVNLGYKAKDIPSSRVNDGICDCCDGSDEYEENVAQCKNICHELGRVEQEQKRNEAELHRRGGAKRAELIARGKQMRAERESRRHELERRLNEQESLKAEKEELKHNAEAVEAEALDLFREQQEQERAESSKEEGDKEADVSEATLAFIRYDSNKDGFVEITELQMDMALDRDHNGVVNVEEAKYFLDDRDRIDLDAFLTLSWPRIKPIKMLAEGLFKPPEMDADVQQESQSPGEKEEDSSHPEEELKTTEQHELAGEHGEVGDDELDEDVYEDEVADAEGTVSAENSSTAPALEYDPETQRLVDLANAARSAFAEVEREIRQIEHEMKEIDDQNAKDYGPSEEFAPLDGECYTYEDREYMYTLCPFERASQKQRSGGSETTLGRWDQWLSDGDNSHAMQKYSHGASCWNGPQRSALVQLKCAIENRITSVTEPNRCEYLFVFETPAVCSGDSKEGQSHDEL